MAIEKRFPADTRLDVDTFLNDGRINAELYALMQERSRVVTVEDNEGKKFNYTVVEKSNVKQTVLADLLGISERTVRTHIKYLIEKGYIIPNQGEDGLMIEGISKTAYILPNMEDIYFLIPLKTLQYLNDNCKDHVLKIYIYLGQRYKYSMTTGQPYEFTLEEIGQHIGVSVKNSSRNYTFVNNALTILQNSGLINYCSFFNGVSQKKKLLSVSLEHIEK